MIHSIVTFGNEMLRCKATPVAAVTDKIRALARDLLESMYAAHGVGLAAEQIGRTEAVFVVDVPPDAEKPECVAANAAAPMPLVIVNPVIEATEGSQRGSEGCLSFPDITCTITRPAKVTVAYLGLDGKPQRLTVTGLLAKAIMHETDHLDGVLLVDRMSPVQRLAVAGQLKRLKAESATRAVVAP